jgi:carboxymethylenebutenolidase
VLPSHPSFYRDAEFITAHAAPLPLTFSATTGESVSFSTSGAHAQGFLVRAANPSSHVLLLFHEWWGLNDYIRREAERLRDSLAGFTVIAVDLFDGSVATTPEQASKQTSGAKPERLGAIIDGAIAYAQSLAGPNARISTVGWCFGGAWSLQAAIHAGGKGAACVLYYGMPDTAAASLNALRAPVLGIFAGRDKWITADRVHEFESAMNRANRSLTVRSFDAEHAFANPSNPHYDAGAGAEAESLMLRFLREKR